MATAPSVVVYIIMYTTPRGSSDQNSHTFCPFFSLFCGLKRDLFVVVCVWWGLVFLFFVAPFSLLAVFYRARAFNQDVSNWNTGAVTSMERSKCTLSLSLCMCVCGHGAIRCGVCC